MRRMKIFGFLFLSGLVTATSSLAGQNRWTSEGPGVGIVTDIMADPRDALVAYAFTAGVFKTSDGGQSWRSINDGLPAPYFSAFLIVPGAPATLVAAIGHSIFISVDGGEHWESRGQIDPQADVQALAFDAASQTLLAGTTSGLFTSTDGALTWIANQSLHDGVDSIAASQDGTIYVIAGGKLYRSIDHGASWVHLDTAQRPFRMIADDRSSIYLLTAGGVMISDDRGMTWRALPTPGFSVMSLVPAESGHVYAFSDCCVYEYRDRAATWTFFAALADGYFPHQIRGLAISPADTTRVYAATGDGVFVRTNSEWVSANKGLPGDVATDVVVTPSKPEVAYAATFREIVKTVDFAHTWETTEFSWWYPRLAVSPTEPNTVYAATEVNGLLKSSDAGQTWEQVTPGSAALLAVAPSDAATIYAAFSNAVSKSNDGGATWMEIMSGLSRDSWYSFGPYSYCCSAGASAIAIDPSDADTVYLGQPSAIFKTTNGGWNWIPVATMPFVQALVIDPSDHNIVYAASGALGVARTIDGGNTWTAAGLIDKSVTTLAITSTDLYAGTEDGHIYRSTDGGQLWQPFEDGLTREYVCKLSVDRSGHHLYAATYAGVYEYDVIDGPSRASVRRR